MPIWSRLVKRYERMYEDPPDKKLSSSVRLSRSLEVIGTDTDRSATYDFLLPLHCNHEPILDCLKELARCWPKIACFPVHVYFTLPQRVFFSWNWITPDGIKKTRMTRHQKEINMIFLVIWIQHTSVTDRWTDKHRPTASTRIASRGKNCHCLRL